MKILFISTIEGASWGGSEELWYLLAERLLEENHIVGICRLEWKPVPPKLQKLVDKGALVLYRPNIHVKRPATDIVFRVKNKLYNQNPWEQIKSFNPDSIVISQGGTFDTFLAKLGPFLINASIPYVIISQHSFEYGYLSDSRRHLYQQIFAKAAKLYFVAHRNKIVAERILASRLRNTAIIYNPIKVSDQIELPYPPFSTIKMACVARLDVEFKGQDILLETIATPKWKERDFKLSFFGEGGHEKYLKELIALYNLEDKVSLCGYVESVSDIWKNHHLLVLPSHSEGTPLSLLEASYCKRPAVVTDVGGNSEVVMEGITGFVAPAATVNSLDTTLEKAWQNQCQWEQMGIESKKYVEKVVGYNNFSQILALITRN